MRIEFRFPDKTINLFVKLRDNPAVNSWAEHFLDGSTSVNASLHDFQDRYNDDGNIIDQQISALNQILNVLDTIGFHYTGSRPTSAADLSHDHTNAIHRFFTHNQDLVNHQDLIDKENVTGWLQKVNDIVHLLEILNPNRAIDTRLISPGAVPDIQLTNHPEFNEQGWWEMTKDMKQYHSREPADVILGHQILGKSILRSYFDQDNPNDLDTSGIHCNNRELFIPVHRNARKEIYDSMHFRNWVASHGQDPDAINYDFPIGDIINRDDVHHVFSRLAFCRHKNQGIPTFYHPE